MKVNDKELIDIDEKTNNYFSEILFNSEILLFANDNPLWIMKLEMNFLNFMINKELRII